MIGLDTNVLVRYIVQDEPTQAACAAKLIETRCKRGDPGRVDPVVLCELVWVLARGYRCDRATIASVVRRILTAEELLVPRAELAWAALRGYESGKADFADYLIGSSNHAGGAVATYTFDRDAAADSSLFRVIPDPPPAPH